ncbi:RHS repeat-associated core domain-containing protein, partial [Streptomyces sp. NPDC005574]|uniref:RHS repeat-associated core domain-containing protein n=1 Tax=Streptomyces sp. NPDC005574 TaxID=3156891 RepID=UPI0033B60B6B
SHNGTPTTNTTDTTHGYTGAEHDEPLNLINLTGREYDPQAETFLTPDPLENNHPTAYADNNPTNLTDPTGYDAIDVTDPTQDLGSDQYCGEWCTEGDGPIGEGEGPTWSGTTVDPTASVCAGGCSGPANWYYTANGNVGSDETGYTPPTPITPNPTRADYGGPDGDFSPTIGPLETGEALSPVQTELENANARVGFSGDNRLIGDGPMWVTEGANYAFVWRVGSIEAGDTAESKMGVMQEDPNAIFPFTVQPVDPSTHQSWDSGLPPASARRVRVGNEYNLYNVETESVVAPKGWLPTISNSPVRVISATPTSFTFVTLPGHIDGPGAHVSFSTFSSGDDVLLMQRGYAPGASRVVTTVQPLSLYAWAWRTQARNLAGYPNGPTGPLAVDYSHEPFVNH